MNIKTIIQSILCNLNLPIKTILPILSGAMVISLAVLACSMPVTNNAPTVVTVVVTQAPSSPKAGPGLSAPIPATGEQPVPTSTGQAAVINHVNRPGIPSGNGPIIQDSDSSGMAAQHHPQGGDAFNINLFERPFNANTQDTYLPHVDLIQSSMINGNPWVYGSITLAGPEPVTNLLNASYALELDLNMDGRGDLLVVANNPTQGDWSTNGVQVFQDPDHDVGGNAPLHAEVLPQGNGYEQKVFDSGQGADPDLAWARVVPGQPNVVWFAFKSTLINNTNKWMWGAWAQSGGLHPELFDYNDHLTLAQAGNPMPGDPNYPLKGLAEVDNTCRGAIGFNPTGSEPGICQAAPAATLPPPTATPKPTAPPTAVPTKPIIKIAPPIVSTLVLKIPPGLLLPTAVPTKPLYINPKLIVPPGL